MAIKPKYKKAFALLIAVIFSAVMLALGTALASLGYKQNNLASTGIQSQYAFYAADAGLECAMYADQQQQYNGYGLLSYYGNDPSVSGYTYPQISCDNILTSPRVNPTYTTSPGSSHPVFIATYRFDLDKASHCADVTVYSYKSPDASGNTTYIFSQGYNVSCSAVAASGTSYVARGLYAKF